MAGLAAMMLSPNTVPTTSTSTISNLLRPYGPDPRTTQERHIGNTAGARILCLDVDGMDGGFGVVGKEEGKSLNLLLGVTNRGDAGFDICS